MYMILKAFKYQLDPTPEQHEILNKHFGCARFIYNWGLNEKSKAYQDNKDNINCFALINRVTEIKKTRTVYLAKRGSFSNPPNGSS